jgi:hypothetical protein
MLYGVRMYRAAIAVVLAITALGCDGTKSPSSPSGSGAAVAAVRIVFAGSTTRRTDLPASTAAASAALGATHIHPSWRSFEAIPLQPVPPDRYEIGFTDVPVGTRVSFRINDQNSCDENPTGAVTRNIFVNDLRVVQNTTTPGNGDEPGFAFTVAPNGTITQ